MVTTQKSKHYTSWALRSFFAHTPLQPADIFILIDNDRDYQLPDECTQFPIKILVNQSPLSFAANVNNMAQRALKEGTDLFFLNNDVIFTPRWIEYFHTPIEVILVPLSNREVQYTLPSSDGSGFACSMHMSLADYVGHEQDFAQIVTQHQERVVHLPTYLPVLCAPFFVVKIPHAILLKVGAFDLMYGVGGGEDYDYCLRAHRCAFSVAYVQRSFLLHFGSKSISNSEAGEPLFVTKFREKWGTKATRLIFDDSPGIFEALGLRAYDFQSLGFGDLIEELCGQGEIDNFISF